MRLLLRRNSHKTVGDSLEIASSPDTPGPDHWQWHLRVNPHAATPAESDTSAITVTRADGSVCLVSVTVDPNIVSAQVTHVELGKHLHIARSEQQLVVLIVGSGGALVEGRHLLSELDAMVLAGDDPLEIELEQVSADPVSLAVVRLDSVAADSIAWVP